SIPILNASLVFRDALSGELLWGPTLWGTGVTLVCTVGLLKLAAHIIGSEEFLFGDGVRGVWRRWRRERA
ncbi:hypothetical protein, partial [uncultured Salinisphaera sp.]|uniref:hypothetical protein n=1 Tax=uncultured Salinisphaera sp. TaxID=359372 RepID=UPI0032B12D47